MGRPARRTGTGRLARAGRRLLALGAAGRSGVGRWASAAAWLLGTIAIVLGWAAGVPTLRASVTASSTPDRVAVEFASLPAWVNGDLLAMLDVTTRRPLDGRVFDRGELMSAHRALLDTGWFVEVDQVRRVRPDLVTVQATFVTPAAVIRDADGDHLVDPRGRLLPRTFPPGGAKHLLAITGARFDRPLRPGGHWKGADVSAALRLLRLVEQRPWRGQVTSIDADAYLSTETLVIVTDLGARIIWGSAPGEESGLEVPAERKLEYLDAAFEEFRRIDTGHTGTLHFYDRGYFTE